MKTSEYISFGKGQNPLHQFLVADHNT